MNMVSKKGLREALMRLGAKAVVKLVNITQQDNPRRRVKHKSFCGSISSCGKSCLDCETMNILTFNGNCVFFMINFEMFVNFS